MKKIERVALAGSGTMGSAIAQHFLMQGLSVLLFDADDAGLSRGMSLIEKSLDEAQKRGIIEPEQRREILSRVRVTTHIDRLAEVQLVVEAVFEDLSVKQALFSKLEDVVATDCILASNTSSFQISAIAQHLQHRERVVGVHYFYHAAKNKLVEIIPSAETDPDLVTNLHAFYEGLGKTPIPVKDAPGFAVNRFFVPWLNEAVRLYQEGLGSIAGIDQLACEVFGVGMGPFALMNATGVPIARHAAEGLAAKLGPFYAPAKKLCERVEAGHDWVLDDATLLLAGKENSEQVKQRLVGATLGVAAQLVSEGVTGPTSVDLGARAGLRWPKGPFELMESIGIAAVSESVREVFAAWDMAMPGILADNPATFELEWVKSEVRGDTGFIIFDTPDRMNALNEAVVSQLERQFSVLDAQDDLQQIIFLGKGKAFVAGADIKFFLDAIHQGDLDRIVRFTEAGQALLNRISASEKRTVALIDGLALGGGLELALACDLRLATKGALMAFPETGIGIYPGLGGTQRSTRLIGMGPAKRLVATGEFISARKALALGLVDRVITEPLEGLETLARICHGLSRTAPEPVEEAAAFVSFDGSLDDEYLKTAGLQAYAKVLGRKAPIALRMAMKMMDQGHNMALDQALALELVGLREIFSSADAELGLSSIVSGKRPHYSGT